MGAGEGFLIVDGKEHPVIYTTSRGAGNLTADPDLLTRIAATGPAIVTLRLQNGDETRIRIKATESVSGRASFSVTA